MATAHMSLTRRHINSNQGTAHRLYSHHFWGHNRAETSTNAAEYINNCVRYSSRAVSQRRHTAHDGTSLQPGAMLMAPAVSASLSHHDRQAPSPPPLTTCIGAPMLTAITEIFQDHYTYTQFPSTAFWWSPAKQTYIIGTLWNPLPHLLRWHHWDQLGSWTPPSWP